MSKAFFILVFALVLLGFLISTTINMYNDMEQLKADNRKMLDEVTQLRSDYLVTAQERDTLKAEKAESNTKLIELQHAYTNEVQARLKAESDTAIYKGMMVDMINNAAATPKLSCTPPEEQATNPENLILSGIVPVGAGSLVILAMASLVVIIINHHRKHKKSTRLA